MNSHDIEIISEKGFYWDIRIDNASILISKRSCYLDFSDLENINRVLESIETAFDDLTDTQLFQRLKQQIGTNNLLRILDALYYKEFISFWASWYSNSCPKTVHGFKNIFRFFFSSGAERRYKNIPLYCEIETYTIQQASIESKRSKRLSYYKDGCYEIAEIAKAGNMIVFEANGTTLELCLSGRPELKDAKVLATYIDDLHKAFEQKDREQMHELIEHLGYKLSADIMGIYFPDLAMRFFLSEARDIVSTQREQVKVYTYLKQYFKVPPVYVKNNFFWEILSCLEKHIPEWENYLIDGNSREICKESDCWIIYDKRPSFKKNIVTFRGTENLKQEYRKFLRKVSTCGEKTIDYRKLIGKAESLQCFFIAMSEGLDIQLNSIADLKKTDIMMVFGLWVKESTYSSATQRMCFYNVSQFYRYITHVSANQGGSPFYGLQAPQHNIESTEVTKPIEKATLEILTKYVLSLPLVYQIAYKISLCTGLRAGSFNELQTSCLVKGKESNYALRISLEKTMRRNIENGKLTYRDYAIPDEFAFEIQAFTEETKEMRKNFDKPYLLVYEKAEFRDGSQRLPLILTSELLSLRLSAYLQKQNIRDYEGYIETFSLRRVRAEMGRLLFASGKNAYEVATYLGNTPAVAQQHYNKSYKIDEARQYNKLYQERIVPSLDVIHHKEEYSAKPKSVMYGYCTEHDRCEKADCLSCKSRIIKKGEESDL